MSLSLQRKSVSAVVMQSARLDALRILVADNRYLRAYTIKLMNHTTIVHAVRNPSWQSRLGWMEEQYRESERQFLQFVRIIPIHNNPRELWSPRLVNLLQNIGAQIDGMFKIVADALALSSSSKHFPSYYTLLNQGGALEMQNIGLKTYVDELQPFAKPSGANAEWTPDWWQAYNGVKHDLPNGILEGKFGHTINALGGLFILHYFAHAISKYDYRSRHSSEFDKMKLLNASEWVDFSDDCQIPESLVKIESWSEYQTWLHQKLRGLPNIPFTSDLMNDIGVDFHSRVFTFLTYLPRISL